MDGWRHSGFNVFAGERIQPREKKSLENLAAYLMLHDLGDIPCRFDILSLFTDGQQGFRIRHITDAF